MNVERLSIIVEGKTETGSRVGTIILNNEAMFNCDLEWLPNYECDVTGVSTTVHAVQWHESMGEIELTTRGSNIPITELGIFETAIEKFEQRKIEIEEENLSQELSTTEEDVYFDQFLTELLSDVEETSEEVNPTE
jgi:hypothetical protein